MLGSDWWMPILPCANTQITKEVRHNMLGSPVVWFQRILLCWLDSVADSWRNWMSQMMKLTKKVSPWALAVLFITYTINRWLKLPFCRFEVHLKMFQTSHLKAWNLLEHNRWWAYPCCKWLFQAQRARFVQVCNF